MFFMLCFCMTIVLKVLNKWCIIGNRVHIVLICRDNSSWLSQKHCRKGVLELIKTSSTHTSHHVGFDAQSTPWNDTKQTRHCGRDIEIAYPFQIQQNSSRQRSCMGHLTALHQYWSREQIIPLCKGQKKYKDYIDFMSKYSGNEEMWFM